MHYPSFLWKNGVEENGTRCPTIPENVLCDLKLPQILRRDIARYALIPAEGEEILLRQGIFREMEKKPSLAEGLAGMKDEVIHFKRCLDLFQNGETDTERHLFFLLLADAFLRAVDSFAVTLSGHEPFGEIRETFARLREQGLTVTLRSELADCIGLRRESVRLIVNGTSIAVAEADGSMQDRFAQWFRRMGIEEDLPQQKVKRRLDPLCLEAYGEINRGHLRRAALLYEKYHGYLLEDCAAADLAYYNDELSFLLDCHAFLCKLREARLPLTYPIPTAERQITVDGLLDLALLSRELPVSDIVPNDVRMSEGEEKLNFYILSGANGGGKTTYLRSVGAAVLLFLLGLPIPAKRGEIYPFRYLFTHFPSNESFEGTGRFVDEEKRAREIAEAAGRDSVALFNETYSGTDEKKSEDYSRRLALEMYRKGVYGLYVTHIHALTGGELPVLAPVIDEEDENRRTYRIRRVNGTDSSFAYDILKKYALDAESLEAARQRRKEEAHA